MKISNGVGKFVALIDKTVDQVSAETYIIDVIILSIVCIIFGMKLAFIHIGG